EYMACGRSVIAPRVGEIVRELTNEVDALLIDSADVSGLAAAISRLYRDPQLRLALGTRARDWVVRFGTWQLQIDRVLEALRSSGLVDPDPAARHHRFAPDS